MPIFKSAFIQGASKGLGLEIVKKLLIDFPDLNIIASSRFATKSYLKDLSEEYPKRLSILDIDLENEKSLLSGIEAIFSLTRTLDLIINTAGFLHNEDFMPEKRLNQLDLTHLKKSFNVNVFGPMFLISKLIKILDKDSSKIINISARVGSIEDNKTGGWYSYRASKAAQNMFTKNISIEMERNKNFICVGLHPGTLDTDLSKPFISKNTQLNIFSPSDGASRLIKIILELDTSDSGTFMDWNGKVIPW